MSGLPRIPVRDLEIQREENDLVVGTFGRGIAIVDDYSPLRLLTEELVGQAAAIFPIKQAKMYIQSRPMAGRAKAFQGASFFTGDNPAFGATITYYLKDSLKTKRGERSKREGKGQDAPYPNWDDLKAEDREESPMVLLTIRDTLGNVIRRLRGSNSSGIHRVTWDFHHTGLQPQSLDDDGRGPMALPGKYTVSLSTWVDGEVVELVGPVEF